MTDIRKMRLLIMVFYCGPWERVSNFCYGLRPDASLRWVIPDKPKGWRRLLARIGDWADLRDRDWRNRYAAKGVNPRALWKRRSP